MSDRQLEKTSQGCNRASPCVRIGWSRLRFVLLFGLLPLLPNCREQTIHDLQSIVELTDTNFDEEVLKSDQPVLVEFWAPWCRPCLEMFPVMESVAHEYSGTAKVGRLQVDLFPQLAKQYNADVPPTFICFRAGQVFKRRSGKQTGDELSELLLNALSKSGSPHLEIR